MPNRPVIGQTTWGTTLNDHLNTSINIDGTLKAAAILAVQTTAPSSPAEGALWYDTDEPVSAPSNGGFASDLSIDLSDPVYALPTNGTSDATAAVQAAVNAASLTMGSENYRVAIEVPPGLYRVREINAATLGKVLFRCTEGGATAQFIYNGTGGAGSHLFNMGSMSHGGFVGVELIGMPPERDRICENLIKVSFVDMLFVLSRVAFSSCYGSAILVTGEIYNWHMDHVRFDAVGGWGFNSTYTSNGPSNLPITLTHFSYDNNVPYWFVTGGEAARITELTNLGVYNGGWGKGVCRIANENGMKLSFAYGRIETNTKPILADGRLTLFRGEQPAGTGGAAWNFDNVTGYADGRPTVILSVNTAFTEAHFGGGTQIYTAPMMETRSALTNPRLNIGPISGGDIHYNGSTNQTQGIVVNAQAIESRDDQPAGGVYALHRRGDFIFKRNADIGGAMGWWVTAPDGYGRGGGGTVTTAAVVTAASATITVPVTYPGDGLSMLAPGTAITVNGAGVAGAALNTTVTNWNGTTGTITVADTPSTSVNPATITIRTPTYTPTGIVGGVQAAAQANSAAGTLAALVTDFNALLAKLRAANQMAP